MCKICLQTPCLSQCPNAMPVIVHECTLCGGEIYLGDTYYDIEGKPICEECINEARREADIECY